MLVPYTTAAVLTLTLRNENGSTAGTQTMSLGPSQQAARFVSELFSGIANFEGSLEISSTSLIAALGLRQSASGIFSVLSAAARENID